MTRLGRYREEVDRSIEVRGGIHATTRRFSERLFEGLEYAALLARRAGLGAETQRDGGLLVLRVEMEPAGTGTRATFGLLSGTAAETDEDLMHEELSRHTLDPSGFSGRILGWSEEAGEDACQVFAVYGDGVWKTKGLFVAKSRGIVDDSEDVLNGFCLRILGRLVDTAALTGGAGRRWAHGPYTLPDLLSGRDHPTELRWSR